MKKYDECYLLRLQYVFFPAGIIFYNGVMYILDAIFNISLFVTDQKTV